MPKIWITPWRASIAAAPLAAIVLMATACSDDSKGADSSTTPSAAGSQAHAGGRASSQNGGTSSHAGGTSKGGGEGGNASNFTLAFAKCMRAHGIPKFPNPNGKGSQLGPYSGIDPGSAKFQAALNGPCRSLAPAAWVSAGSGSVRGGGS
jgi:hypothetical protein